MRVVSDTGPLNYLALIGLTNIVPTLFGSVSVPICVVRELQHRDTPTAVRAWIATSPVWLDIQPDVDTRATDLDTLDQGERAAILLALSLGARLVLMDDRAGVAIARRMGLTVTGTIGLLDLAARRNLVSLADAFDALKKTSFRCKPALFDAVLALHRSSI